MKKNEERLNHGLHNETVCDYLELKNEFADWIITTAFYSALQFVSYYVFPIEITDKNGKKRVFGNIDSYYRVNNHNRISKHNLLSDLVYHWNPKIADEYKWLLDMSMTARYQNYQQDKLISNKARSLLKKIKKECI